jgi:hypothetical protein
MALGRSRKDPYSPHVPEKINTPPMFLIIVNVLGHPKGRGGMDVFWNDPFQRILFV